MPGRKTILSRRAGSVFVAVVVGGLVAGCGGGADLNEMVAAGFGQSPFGSETAQREVDVNARGPLVLPPDYNLPQPRNEEQQAATLGANWPTDPEVTRKQQAKERADRLAALEKKNRSAKEGRARTLSPEEMATWGKGLAVAAPGAPVKKRPDGAVMSPEDLKSYGGVEEDPAMAGIPPEQQPLPPLPQ